MKELFSNIYSFLNKKTIYIFDMVFDHVFSRFLNPCLIAFLMYILVSEIFVSSKGESPFPNSLQVIVPPPSSISAGTISRTFIVKVLDQLEEPYKGANIMINLIDLVVYSDNGEIDCGFETIQQILWNYKFINTLGPCSIVLSGEFVTSSEGGFSFFKNFSFVKSPQGSFYFNFMVKGSEINSNAQNILVSYSVFKVKILNSPPLTATFNVPLSIQPKMIAYDEYMNPISGRYFDAISCAYGTFNLLLPTLFDPDSDKFAFLSGARSEPSNLNGLAEFLNLTIVGSTHQNVNIILISDGIKFIMPWGKDEFPNVKTKILKRLFQRPISINFSYEHTFEIINSGPSSHLEGVSFDPSPSINVNDTKGPLQGLVCFALLREFNYMKFPVGFQPQYYRDYPKQIIKGMSGKYFDNNFSNPDCVKPEKTDRYGVIEFKELGISRFGSNYQQSTSTGILFSCGNGFSTIYYTFVNTSVKSIQLSEFSNFLSLDSNSQISFNFISDIEVYVLDENKNPMPNKSVNSIRLLNADKNNDSTDIIVRPFQDFPWSKNSFSFQTNQYGIFTSKAIIVKSNSAKGNYFWEVTIDGIKAVSNSSYQINIDMYNSNCFSIILQSTFPNPYNISLKDNETFDLNLTFFTINGSNYKNIASQLDLNYFYPTKNEYFFSVEEISILSFQYNLTKRMRFTLPKSKNLVSSQSESLLGFFSGTYLSFIAKNYYIGWESTYYDDETFSCTHSIPLIINYFNSIKKVILINPLETIDTRLSFSISNLKTDMKIQILDNANKPLKSFKINISTAIYQYPQNYYYHFLSNDYFGSMIFTISGNSQETDENGTVSFTIKMNGTYFGNCIFSVTANGIASVPIYLDIISEVDSINLIESPVSNSFLFLSAFPKPFTIKVTSTNSFVKNIPILAFFNSNNLYSYIDIPFDMNFSINLNKNRLQLTNESGYAIFNDLRVLGYDNSNSSIPCVNGYFYFKLGVYPYLESSGSNIYSFSNNESNFLIYVREKHDMEFNSFSFFQSPIVMLIKESSTLNIINSNFPLLFHLRIFSNNQKELTFFDSYQLTDALFANQMIALSNKIKISSTQVNNIVFYINSFRQKYGVFKEYNLVFSQLYFLLVPSIKKYDFVVCLYNYCNYSSRSLYGLQTSNYKSSFTLDGCDKSIAPIQSIDLINIVTKDGSSPTYLNIKCNIVSQSYLNFQDNSISFLINLLFQDLKEQDLFHSMSANTRIKLDETKSRGVINYWGVAKPLLVYEEGKSGYYFVECGTEFGSIIRSNVFFVKNQINYITIIEQSEYNLNKKFELISDIYQPIYIILDFTYVLKFNMSNDSQNIIDYSDLIQIEIYDSDSHDQVIGNLLNDDSILGQLSSVWNILIKGENAFKPIYAGLSNIADFFNISRKDNNYVISNITFRVSKPGNYWIKFVCLGEETDFSSPIIIHQIEYENSFEFLGYHSHLIFYITISIMIINNSLILSIYSLLLNTSILVFNIVCFVASKESMFGMIYGLFVLAVSFTLYIIQTVSFFKYGTDSFFINIKEKNNYNYSLSRIKKMFQLKMNKDKPIIQLIHQNPTNINNSRNSSVAGIINEVHKEEKEKLGKNFFKSLTRKIRRYFNIFALYDKNNCFYFPQRYIMAIFLTIFTLIYCTYQVINNILFFLSTLEILQISASSTIFSFINRIMKGVSDKFNYELNQDQLNYYYNLIQEFLSILTNFQKTIKVSLILTIFIVFLIFLICLLNLSYKFKNQILKARKSEDIIKSFNEAEIFDASEFVGSMIGNSAISFLVVTFLITIILGILFNPLFWVFLWEIKITLLIFIIPDLAQTIISYFLEEIIFEKPDIIKHPFILQLYDGGILILSIFGGFVASFSRFIYGLIGLFVSLISFDQTFIPKWVKIPFMEDQMNKTFQSLIHLHILYSNPIFLNSTLVINQPNTQNKKNILCKEIWIAFILYKFPFIQKFRSHRSK